MTKPKSTIRKPRGSIVFNEKTAKQVYEQRPWVAMLANVSIRFGIREICTYCGTPAFEQDHVIPWSWTSDRARKSHAGAMPGLKTWACRECNQFLGNTIFPSFAERVIYANLCLAKKYRRIVMGAMWSRGEISELKGMLKVYVAGKQHTRDLLAGRVDWIYSSTFAEILENARFAAETVSHDALRGPLVEFFARPPVG